MSVAAGAAVSSLFVFALYRSLIATVFGLGVLAGVVVALNRVTRWRVTDVGRVAAYVG